MAEISNFILTDITTENFFNENETGILNTVNENGTGVYKLSQDRNTEQFTDVSKVDTISEEGVSVNEMGRIITTEGDVDYLYVSFVV